MEIQVLFPRWRAASDDEARVPWSFEIDLSSDNAYGGLLAVAAAEQNRAVGTPGYFDLVEAMVQDAANLAAAIPSVGDPIDLHYLQFELALSPFRNAMGRGDFGRAHDWIHHGLSDTVEHAIQRALHVYRIGDFMRSQHRWIVDNRVGTLSEWAADFYYYCRVRGVLQDAAKALLPILLPVVDDLPNEDQRALDALAMMLNWAVDYGDRLAPPITAKLHRTFNRSTNLDVRTKIAATFATTAGALSGRPSRYWAAWALDNGVKYLSPHQRLQLLFQQVKTTDDWGGVRPKVLDAIRDYASEVAGLGSPTAISRATDQRSGVLKAAFYLMNKLERADDLLELLALWHGVPDANRLRSGAMFVCTTSHDGTRYLGDRSQLIGRDGTTQVTELANATNDFLGVIITIQGQEPGIVAPERPGHPDGTKGAEFAVVVTNAYAFSELSPEVMAGRRSIIAFPGLPHPVQAMMVAELGASLPIAASLEEPRPDRPIRKALLWAAANDFYSKFEIDAVAAVLSRAGIEVVAGSGEGASPTDFLGAYADASFDVVWVAGHGEVDHWHDGWAHLLAGSSCRVEVDDLHAAGPRTGDRRLAVFNVCDGGVSVINGGIQKLGLAPMLASSRQATISHLWPVNPLVASAFGVALADALARGEAFHAAFDRALGLLHAPAGQIADAIRTIIPEHELIDRLHNLSLETENILHWGSPIFFQ